MLHSEGIPASWGRRRTPILSPPARASSARASPPNQAPGELGASPLSHLNSRGNPGHFVFKLKNLSLAFPSVTRADGPPRGPRGPRHARAGPGFACGEAQRTRGPVATPDARPSPAGAPRGGARPHAAPPPSPAPRRSSMLPSGSVQEINSSARLNGTSTFFSPKRISAPLSGAALTHEGGHGGQGRWSWGASPEHSAPRRAGRRGRRGLAEPPGTPSGARTELA